MTTYYKIFKWDSRNTGFYMKEFISSLKKARAWAKDFGGEHYSIEGDNHYFEEYKGGKKVSWSA